MKYLNIGLGIVLVSLLVLAVVTFRDNVLAYVAMAVPVLVVLYLSSRWRRYAIEEIDAAGGYAAWKQKYGPAREA